MLTINQIKKIKHFASEQVEKIAAIYLFGSRARLRAKPGIDVDLVDMKKASPLLRHQIYKYGKEIYSAGQDYPALFRDFSIKEYLDSLYLYETRMKIIYG